MKFLSGNGYFVDPKSDHKILLIGGQCKLPGAISPNNGLPLTQFVELDIDKNAFWIPNWNTKKVNLLYSWKCGIHEGDFTYRYSKNEIEIIEFTSGNDDFNDFPYINYPVLFKEFNVGLKSLSDEDKDLIIKLNDDEEDNIKFSSLRSEQLSVPQHQFGGKPYLINPSESEKKCVICGEEMPIVASIGNKSFSNDDGFFGNDFVQVLYWACASCNTISARNFSD